MDLQYDDKTFMPADCKPDASHRTLIYHIIVLCEILYGILRHETITLVIRRAHMKCSSQIGSLPDRMLLYYRTVSETNRYLRCVCDNGLYKSSLRQR